MNSQQTLDKIVSQIKAATAAMNLPEITRLSQLAQRVQAIDAQMVALREELLRIENSLGVGEPLRPFVLPINPPAPKPDGDVIIEINWGLCNIARPNARISERMMSDTMVSVMNELLAALGVEALHKLTALRVSRGPLVSRNPQTDYVNSKTGANYVSHPIGHSGYNVLTHSGTAEKIAAIKEAWQFLGLTPGALSITKNSTR